MYLIFDTETTGLPKNFNAPITDTDNWPRAVQIAWQLHDNFGRLIEHQDFLIRPDGFDIPYDSERIHGISTELAYEQGVPMVEVLQKFQEALQKTTYIVGQNIDFDINIMGCEFFRYQIQNNLTELPVLDTCTEITANLCQLPGGKGGRFKLPTLTELHQFLFGIPFSEAHNATADVEATTRCFFELIRIGKGFSEEFISEDYIREFQQHNPSTIKAIGLVHINLKNASEEIRKKSKKETELETSEEILEQLAQATFVHLHNHSQYTILQATSSVEELVKAASIHRMPAVALTDTANMMGAFLFVQAVSKYNKSVNSKKEEALKNGEEITEIPLKAIIGCEFNICANHKDRNLKDNGYQSVILAKNKNGYQNLCKMASIAYTEGYYYVPRIDKEIIRQYKDDLIVLSGNLQGEIPSKILNIGEKQAEEALLWWKDLFGDDFYLEIMRHGQEDENRANEVLIKFAEKHGVKLVATNNTFYIEEKDAETHDILLCVKNAEKKSTPIGRGRGFRYGFENQEYYFKSTEQMKELFKDIPQAIFSIQEIIDKIEPYDLARNVLLPKFDIPQEFSVENDPTGKEGENKYLRHLTYAGAEKKYPKITDAIRERLDFELEIIAKTGYPGYFLIVQDLIKAARDMGVSVGPGRGSAAGSAVAYCLNITNIDPIEYDLLFERFLNPDRVSMPDIDIDFDSEGRELVMQYVINKYGANQVAQIITYGTMAAKSSIRDAARVLDLPLPETDRIAKLVPNIKLSALFSLSDEELSKKLKNKKEDIDNANQLKQISEENSLQAKIIKQARALEGSLRNTGVHACGVIITPDDITNFVPVAVAKDSALWITQFDNSVAESAGLLKMDFLGLATLTLIKDTIEIIKQTKGIEIDPDKIPIDDVATYELFQRGETIGIFQYESAGMQKYLKELKPTVFPDLIAMNALYRPGPLEYIPSFIKRKHGEEPIIYDLPEMQEILEETYGVTVYQEQVMRLSQKLANFTKGDADSLRKGMGKKIKAILEKLKPKFIEGGISNGHPEEALRKIWTDWEAFAEYAFNKSHSTCYAWVAYQTAYLKANYPAEYMAAVLSNNMDKIDDIRLFLEECKRMGISVLVPDINESNYKFSVTPTGAIRFGLGAIKGVGQSAVDSIIQSRQSGKFSSIFDVAKRVDLRSVNKKAFENIILAGGFDSFGGHRAQYFHTEPNEANNFLHKIISYGAKSQENANSAQLSLFGNTDDITIPQPPIPDCPEWNPLYKLQQEKETIGLFISGHPLDDFQYEREFFSNTDKLKNGLQEETLSELINQHIEICGIITSFEEKISKSNTLYGNFSVEDTENSYKFSLFKEDYLKFRMYLIPNHFVYLKIIVQQGYLDKKTQRNRPARLKVEEIIPLGLLFEQKTKKLVVSMSENEVSQDKIQSLQNIFSQHQGDKTLTFKLLGKINQRITEVSLESKQKIKISSELIKSLKDEKISFSIE